MRCRFDNPDAITQGEIPLSFVRISLKKVVLSQLDSESPIVESYRTVSIEALSLYKEGYILSALDTELMMSNAPSLRPGASPRESDNDTRPLSRCQLVYECVGATVRIRVTSASIVAVLVG